MSELMADPNASWMVMAACRHTDPGLFFLPLGCNDVDYAKPKAVCATCPVQRVCLEYALALDLKDGCWGMTSPDERRKIRRQRLRAAQTERIKREGRG